MQQCMMNITSVEQFDRRIMKSKSIFDLSHFVDELDTIIIKNPILQSQLIDIATPHIFPELLPR